MSLSYYYKLGFLTACADRGLGPDQAEALASQVLKRAGIPAGGLLGCLPAPAGVKAAFSPLGLAAGVVKAPLWLAGKAFQGAGNLGAAAGLGAGSVLYGDPEEHLRPLSVRSPEAAARDSLARLRGMTDELRRRKAELVKTPGLFA